MLAIIGGSDYMQNQSSTKGDSESRSYWAGGDGLKVVCFFESLVGRAIIFSAGFHISVVVNGRVD
jgi:hypothetical protein